MLPNLWAVIYNGVAILSYLCRKLYEKTSKCCKCIFDKFGAKSIFFPWLRQWTRASGNGSTIELISHWLLSLLFSFESFSHQCSPMVSHLRLSNAKSRQVSRTLLSILTDLNNAVVWIVSTRPLIYKSSNPCTNPMVTVPREPITISITVTFMFHSFSIPLRVFITIFNWWSFIEVSKDCKSP